MVDLGPHPDFDAFQNACSSIGVHVSREIFDRLSAYVELLKTHSQHYNLIGPREISKIWTRHVFDAVQLFPHIPSNASIGDLGSGAGFPGVVLSFLGASSVTLIESSEKKCRFLKSVSCEAKIINDRIENIRDIHFKCITSRALAPLNELLSYAISLGSAETVCVFNKGKSYEAEMEIARKKFHFDETVYKSVTDPYGVVLVVEKIKKKT